LESEEERAETKEESIKTKFKRKKQEMSK
jgi:hypothetical protein